MSYDLINRFSACVGRFVDWLLVNYRELSTVEILQAVVWVVLVTAFFFIFRAWIKGEKDGYGSERRVRNDNDRGSSNRDSDSFGGE